jgi:hypothetical protein
MPESLQERKSRDVRAFEVTVAGTEWTKVIYARSAGQAKVEYWRDVCDAWPGTPYTLMRARRRVQPPPDPEFQRCAEYRGLPHVRLLDRVTVKGGGRGVIVGHNGSANFDVLFDEDSPEYRGQRLNVHPASCHFGERA